MSSVERVKSDSGGFPEIEFLLTVDMVMHFEMVTGKNRVKGRMEEETSVEMLVRTSKKRFRETAKREIVPGHVVGRCVDCE